MACRRESPATHNLDCQEKVISPQAHAIPFTRYGPTLLITPDSHRAQYHAVTASQPKHRPLSQDHSGSSSMTIVEGEDEEYDPDGDFVMELEYDSAKLFYYFTTIL